MTPEVISDDRQIVRGEPLHSFQSAAVIGTDPPHSQTHFQGMQGSPPAGQLAFPKGCGSGHRMWKIPKSMDPVLDPCPSKRVTWAARWLVPELEHMVQPALLQAALHPPFPVLPYVISSFFPSFSEQGFVMRAQGAATGMQREEVASTVTELHVLHLLSPVSAGHSSLAADRSYSEPGSMGKCEGLGDSHRRHAGRRAAGREEQVGFLRRFPHLSPLCLLSCKVAMMQMSFSFPSLQGLQSKWVLLPRSAGILWNGKTPG